MLFGPIYIYMIKTGVNPDLAQAPNAFPLCCTIPLSLAPDTLNHKGQLSANRDTLYNSRAGLYPSPAPSQKPIFFRVTSSCCMNRL